MRKFLTMAALAILVTFDDGTSTKYEYKSAWTVGPMLYLYDEYDKKQQLFVGDYEAIKLDNVKSYKKVDRKAETAK